MKLPDDPKCRRATNAELAQLRAALPDHLIRPWFEQLLLQHALICACFSLPENASGELVSLQWMSPAQIIDEMQRAYPAILAGPAGFLAVGMDSSGGGDYYFLKMSDADSPLYRIPHEAARGDALDLTQCQLIAPSLSDFFAKATVQKPGLELAFFSYRELYDVPRLMVVPFAGRTFVLDSRFIEEQDDYSDSYEVYLMPEGFVAPGGDWSSLHALASKRLGAIPVKSVKLDPTKRKSLRANVLAPFLRDL
jgi:hypothetical protein